MSIDPPLLAAIALMAAMGSSLRKFLDLPNRAPRFTPWLRWLWVPGVVLAGVQLLLPALEMSPGWYLVVGMAVAGYVLYTLRAYRPARTLLLAGAPLLVLTTARLLLKLVPLGVFEPTKVVINTAQVFSVIWMAVFVGIARRDKRILAAEDAETAARARQRAEEEARQAELEHLVSERTATLREQTATLEKALLDLRATQSQLIQSEKMASLGELTAGIAHEIQNPLNFVNNFAEVSAELLAELKEAQAAGDTAEVEALADDLTQNLTKITEHGRRAAGIVKGMLQHSRASTDERTPTDLNALCDEYLRLAYHGLRAKDKTFNATLQTAFDPALPALTVVAPDVGRVLLNLLTNAFYAVRERQRTAAAPGYQPTVSVQTRALPNGGAEVRVRDNGTGIPDAIQHKMFQPFFTTKPTGEGTGLGLSLSFDIITKAHRGTLAVESTEGTGTTFVVTLPGG